MVELKPKVKFIFIPYTRINLKIKYFYVKNKTNILKSIISEFFYHFRVGKRISNYKSKSESIKNKVYKFNYFFNVKCVAIFSVKIT